MDARSGWWGDLRSAWRGLRRDPGFSLVVVLTLALGIGANSAIFTVAKGVMLNPLDYPEPEELMVVMEANPEKGFPRFSVSPPNWLDFRDQNKTFEVMSAHHNGSYSLTGDGRSPERLLGRVVTGDYFKVYGVPPVKGRPLSPDDDQPGAEKVTLLGYRLWTETFGGSDMIDQTITLDGEGHRVVGVMPEGFQRQFDVFVPLAMEYDENERGAHYLSVRGRLAAGVTPAMARTDLESVAARLAEVYPDSNTGWTALVDPLHELMVEDFRSVLFLLFGAVALVLLIACVNVANLLLVRLAQKEREVALRTALGAPQGALVRRWLAETLSLSLLGGVVGIVLAVVGTKFLVNLAADEIPRAQEVAVDPGVLFFSFALSVVTGIVLGFLPVVQSRDLNVGLMLKEGGRGQAGGRRGKQLRAGLVVAEVALAMVLLIGAGLLTRSLDRLLRVDPGFSADGVLTAGISLPASRYGEDEQMIRFYQQLTERLQRIPGVTSAATVYPLPLGDDGFVLSFYVEGTEIPEANQEPHSHVRVVGQDYFDTLKIPLLTGRSFDEKDVEGSEWVGVINRTLAEKLWPNESPLGRRITFDDPEDEEVSWLRVVGVVADVRHDTLRSEGDPELYWLERQNPIDSTHLVLRTDGDPNALVAPLRSELAALDADLPIFDVGTMQSRVDASLSGSRLNSLLVGLFAALALLLASLGVYGVISYSVSQNTREIGVRLALGARQTRILGWILGRGFQLVGLGVAVGWLLGFAVSRALSGMVYEISTTDFMTFSGAALVLVVIGLLSSWLPARWAVSVDPAVVLRDE